MNTELLEIMKMDIKRCEESQNSNEGTHRLYQALNAKYNGIFEGFEKDIPTSEKAAFGGGEFNYRPELNAIKEKLELLIVTDNDKDPLFNFKVMYEDDLESLKKLFPMLKIERHQNEKNYSCIKMLLQSIIRIYLNLAIVYLIIYRHMHFMMMCLENRYFIILSKYIIKCCLLKRWGILH